MILDSVTPDGDNMNMMINTKNFQVLIILLIITVNLIGKIYNNK